VILTVVIITVVIITVVIITVVIITVVIITVVIITVVILTVVVLSAVIQTAVSLKDVIQTVMLFFYSCINPFIYAIILPAFRQFVLSLCKTKKKREEKISKIRQKMALTQVASQSETAF
jgi:hypothetical protein